MISLSQYITEKNLDTYTKQMYDYPVKNAVWNYVAGYTTGVNNDLRAGKGGSKNVKKYLDQAFVNKQELDVYRVVDWDYMKNIYNITPETLDNFIGKTIIKTTAEDNSVMYYDSVSPIAPMSLFTPPADYKKTTLTEDGASDIVGAIEPNAVLVSDESDE